MSGIKILFTIVLVFLILTGAAASPLNSNGGTWKYQRDITIRENSGITLSDYQVLVELRGENFPNEAQSSGADIRFMDSKGSDLYYWIESWDHAGKRGKVWVKVPFIPRNEEAKLIMYYGNPDAISESDGNKVFDFFGDEASKFISDGIGYFSVNNKIINISVTGGILHPYIVRSDVNFTDFIAESDARFTSTNAVPHLMLYGRYTNYSVRNFIECPIRGYADDLYVYEGIREEGDIAYEDLDSKVNVWYFLRMKVGGTDVEFFARNLITGREGATSVTTSTISPGGAGVGVWQPVTTAEYRNFRVRKYAPIEPTVVFSRSSSGLVAEWRFDEWSGNVVEDSSGNGNDGVIHGATRVEGKFGRALNFDGINDYIEIPDSPGLDITGNISIETWIRLNSLPGMCCPHIINKAQHLGEEWDGNYWLALNPDGRWTFSFAPSGQNAIDHWSSGALRTGQWYHIVITFDESRDEIKYYVNGALDNSFHETNVMVTDNFPIWIGGRFTKLNDLFINSTIDSVSIYNRTLSDDEIQSHYKEEMSGQSTEEVKTQDETAQVSESDIYYYPDEPSVVPWNVIFLAIFVTILAIFFLLIRKKRESKKEGSIANQEMDNLKDENIKIWVYILFFLGGILSIPIGGGILIIILSSGILNQYAFFSSGLGFYLQFSIFLLPMFTCSIFFAIGMYFFKSKLYTYAIKAFVASFVASSFILSTGVITGLILPFILPLLIFAVIWLVSGRNPDMKFPLKAFISTFLIPILINIAGIFYLLLIFGVNSRL